MEELKVIVAALRWVLVALLSLVAVSAVPVGVLFVLAPDGSGVGMPLAVLAGTPFSDFTVPGFFLALAVGGSQALAAVLVARRHPAGPGLALLAAAILAGWIGVQIALIGLQSGLQSLIAGVALGELGASLGVSEGLP